MEPGTIVEYIDQQRIFCAVVLTNDGQRVRLLTEVNTEVRHRISRLLHVSKVRLKLGSGREPIVARLREIAAKRRALAEKIDIKVLWEVLSEDPGWIDLQTMTGLCFASPHTSDHEAAVIRAIFFNRVYFKMKNNEFFPLPAHVVEAKKKRLAEEKRLKELASSGAKWLKAVLSNSNSLFQVDSEITEALKSYYLFGKESRDSTLARTILSRASVSVERIPDALIKAGIWGADENIDIHRMKIPVEFPGDVVEEARMISLDSSGLKDREDSSGLKDREARKDLTSLEVFTIDGPNTLDFDDALSVERKGDFIEIGVHIADVDAYVKRGDSLDREALARATSIYMPDMRIPMFPHVLAEDLCSLIEGQTRPAISVIFSIDTSGNIIDYRFYPSIVRVSRQLTYMDVDAAVDSDPGLRVLYAAARMFREERMKRGALQIVIPELNIRVLNGGDVSVRLFDRESPSKLLVSEMMIMANCLAAKFIAGRGLPAIFRSQPPPKGRLYNDPASGTLFQHWMQRRLLSRLVISSSPAPHSGLGVDAYTTATSPIRKYSDLVSQRQIKACLGMGKPYTIEEIDWIISSLEVPLTHASLVTSRRIRYWLLKHLERRIGQRLEAIVLDSRGDGYTVLLPEYLMESRIPASRNITLRPQDIVQVVVQHADARNDRLSLMIS